MIFLTSVTTVTAVTFFYILSTSRKSNLTHLTTNVMISGQHYVILAMLCGEVASFLFGGEVALFLLLRGGAILCLERLQDFCV